jgi:hypothetical protein
MHPLGFWFAILTHQQRAKERSQQLPPEEPLPPVDDATIRAWRAWARGERPSTRPSADKRRAPAPTSVTSGAGSRAERPA